MRSRPPTAISGEGSSPYEEEFLAIGLILERDAAPIMERWFERASQEQVHPSENKRAEVMNDLRQMLQSLGQRLQEQTQVALDHATAVAAAHGRQRAHLDWDIVELVQDYELLHGVVLEHLGEVWQERLSYRQAMVVAMAMSRATGSAVEAYNRLIQRQLEEANEQLEAQVAKQRHSLRQMTLELSDAEHRLRQQFAGMLHDDFQQMLVAIRMKLQAAQFGKAATPERPRRR